LADEGGKGKTWKGRDKNLVEAKALLASARARIAFLEEGDLVEARENYEQALSIYKEIDKSEGIADTLTNLGNIYLRLGKTKEAIKHYEESLEHLRKLNKREPLSDTLNDLGEILISQGEYKQAEARLKEALKFRREPGKDIRVARGVQ
jgi:tetratricopeptide (TPR) repeat protein